MTAAKELLKTYDHTDIQDGGLHKGHPFQFIADVAGDNPWLSDLQEESVDNHFIASKLKQLGAVGDGTVLDCESCCFYAYFRTKHDGVEFLRKLRAWLTQKAHLLEKARAY